MRESYPEEPEEPSPAASDASEEMAAGVNLEPSEDREEGSDEEGSVDQRSRDVSVRGRDNSHSRADSDDWANSRKVSLAHSLYQQAVDEDDLADADGSEQDGAAGQSDGAGSVGGFSGKASMAPSMYQEALASDPEDDEEEEEEAKEHPQRKVDEEPDDEEEAESPEHRRQEPDDEEEIESPIHREEALPLDEEDEEDPVEAAAPREDEEEAGSTKPTATEAEEEEEEDDPVSDDGHAAEAEVAEETREVDARDPEEDEDLLD